MQVHSSCVDFEYQCFQRCFTSLGMGPSLLRGCPTPLLWQEDPQPPRCPAQPSPHLEMPRRLLSSPTKYRVRPLPSCSPQTPHSTMYTGKGHSKHWLYCLLFMSPYAYATPALVPTKTKNISHHLFIHWAITVCQDFIKTLLQTVIESF